jgi:hypothetical protein
VQLESEKIQASGSDKYPKGFTKEDMELMEDLEKLSLKNLTQKFMERLNHLKSNQVTREEMTQRLRDLSSRYKKK